MVLENWGKNLEINWEARSSIMCGVFGIYNFLTIYLTVGFGCWV